MQNTGFTFISFFKLCLLFFILRQATSQQCADNNINKRTAVKGEDQQPLYGPEFFHRSNDIRNCLEKGDCQSKNYAIIMEVLREPKKEREHILANKKRKNSKKPFKRKHSFIPFFYMRDLKPLMQQC